MTNERPTGNGSVTVTPSALAGPAFETSIVYENASPEGTFAGPVLWMDRSKRRASTKLVTVSSLFEASGSCVDESTLTLLSNTVSEPTS